MDGPQTAAVHRLILSAGAIETPMILERSGIGRADVLARAGVDQRAGGPHGGARVWTEGQGMDEPVASSAPGTTQVASAGHVPSWSRRVWRTRLPNSRGVVP